ncbi:MAG: nicotinate-nucleotide adenylyltransferase [Thermoanaerobaculia bacterium]
MRLGLYGGSFDPIHRGHLDPVREAMEEMALDRVVYLPTAYPPHKGDRELASPFHRYVMVELALLDDPGLIVSPHELVEGVSYTVETLRHFRRRYPEGELFFLLGSDSFVGLESWREWSELPGLARLIVMRRPGWEEATRPESLSPGLADLVAGGQVLFAANRPIDAAATTVRRELAEGREVTHGELPERVLQYIRKYDLYR